MITNIPDRERDLQAQVDALTEELERLRAQEPVALKSVHLIRDVQGMCAVLVNGRMAIRDNGDIIDHFATLDWFAAPPAQPAEPVQRLSDERAAFEAWHNEYRTQELVRRDDTYYNTHVRCRWEGWQARAIESALQPGWRDIETPPGWKLVPICLTPEMREVLLMADRFTVGEVYIMLLAAAPKATK